MSTCFSQALDNNSNFIMIKLAMLLCGFRTCSFVNNCSEKHKKCVLVGYLKGVNSVHAHQEGHLLSGALFFQYHLPCSQIC